MTVWITYSDRDRQWIAHEHDRAWIVRTASTVDAWEAVGLALLFPREEITEVIAEIEVETTGGGVVVQAVGRVWRHGIFVCSRPARLR